MSKTPDWNHNCIGNGCRFVGCENQINQPRCLDINQPCHFHGNGGLMFEPCSVLKKGYNKVTRKVKP